MKRTLIKNIGCLQTPVGSYSHKGSKQGVNEKLTDAAILIEDGIIREITSDGRLPGGLDHAGADGAASEDGADVTAAGEGGARPEDGAEASYPGIDEIIDAGGKLVTPGLFDGHTHLIFGGYRQHEIAMKLAGADYLDILRAGGGILDTVRKTREASEEELYEKAAAFLDEMLDMGITGCEAKSGYGLDPESEIKMLQVIRALGQKHPMDVVPTFMGAHAIPPEYEGRGDDYIRMCCEELMPQVRREGLAEFADIFCEDSVFNAAQSRIYLEAAATLGFGLKIHADEIEAIGGSELAGELEAASAEHLIAIEEPGMDAMAAGGTTAMLLPATSFYLGKPYAPARRMIEKGIPVAIASDFNPGSCPSLNLQLVINLGCLKYRMTPEEVLTAVTINPACACGRGDLLGTLEVGKQADLVIWNAPDFEMVCYRFGSNLAQHVMKRGELVK